MLSKRLALRVEFALVQHVHQERFYDIVHVVAECNLIVAVFAGELDEFGAALRAAPVAVELAAFLDFPSKKGLAFARPRFNLFVTRSILSRQDGAASARS